MPISSKNNSVLRQYTAIEECHLDGLVEQLVFRRASHSAPHVDLVFGSLLATVTIYQSSPKGSITGAYSARTPNVNPSFILLAVQGSKVVCYVYELKDGEVDVSKTEFSKQ